MFELAIFLAQSAGLAATVHHTIAAWALGQHVLISQLGSIEARVQATAPSYQRYCTIHNPTYSTSCIIYLFYSINKLYHSYHLTILFYLFHMICRLIN